MELCDDDLNVSCRSYEDDIKKALAKIDALGDKATADLEERAMLYLDISHMAKIAKLYLALETDARPGPDYYVRRKERNAHWKAINDRLIDELARRQEQREEQRRRELLGSPTLN